VRLSPGGSLGGVLFALALVGGVSAPSSQPPAGNFDPSIRPQDDLFGYVNGRWLASTEVPQEKVTFGTLSELGDRVEADLRAIIEETAAAPNPRRGSTAQQVGDLYASLMDEARIESLGLTPIKPQLDLIYAARTMAEFAAQSGRIAAIGGGGPFDGTVDADSNTGELVVQLAQSGILLPDRDYYLTSTPKYERFRSGYVNYLARIFSLAGRADGRGEAEAVLALETELARAQWGQAESRDARRTANRMAFSDLGRSFPGFDWREWAKPQGIDRLQTVVIAQPSFFKRFAELATTTPLETWKAWLAARYLTSSAPFISEAFSDARFDFFGRDLSGQELPRTRWRRAVALVSGYLGDAVGRLYVQKHFPASSGEQVEGLVETLVDAFKQAIGESEWMTPGTRRRALQKLSLLSVKIGHPRKWRAYGGLDIRRDDLFGNIQRAREFESRERLARARSSTPLDEWLVTPQTVNAYYSPARNELIVTAALLQPPVFDPAADAATNYGAIGAIVGHEIGHGFDDRGRYFDGRGQVRDWWTAEDEAAFATRARMLVDQFNEFSPAPGLKVDGQLTLSENIGDLVGLSIAYRAYKLALRGQAAPVVNGMTGDQRFFVSWANTWRGKLRDEYMRQWLLQTTHAPPQYRTNGPVSNLDAFYEAFEVRPGDRLFREPARRIRIW
jgi:putative endopeptidase